MSILTFINVCFCVCYVLTSPIPLDVKDGDKTEATTEIAANTTLIDTSNGNNSTETPETSTIIDNPTSTTSTTLLDDKKSRRKRNVGDSNETTESTTQKSSSGGNESTENPESTTLANGKISESSTNSTISTNSTSLSNDTKSRRSADIPPENPESTTLADNKTTSADGSQETTENSSSIDSTTKISTRKRKRRKRSIDASTENAESTTTVALESTTLADSTTEIPKNTDVSTEIPGSTTSIDSTTASTEALESTTSTESTTLISTISTDASTDTTESTTSIDSTTSADISTRVLDNTTTTSIETVEKNTKDEEEEVIYDIIDDDGNIEIDSISKKIYNIPDDDNTEANENVLSRRDLSLDFESISGDEENLEDDQTHRRYLSPEVVVLEDNNNFKDSASRKSSNLNNPDFKDKNLEINESWSATRRDIDDSSVDTLIEEDDEDQVGGTRTATRRFNIELPIIDEEDENVEIKGNIAGTRRATKTATRRNAGQLPDYAIISGDGTIQNKAARKSTRKCSSNLSNDNEEELEEPKSTKQIKDLPFSGTTRRKHHLEDEDEVDSLIDEDDNTTLLKGTVENLTSKLAKILRDILNSHLQHPYIDDGVNVPMIAALIWKKFTENVNKFYNYTSMLQEIEYSHQAKYTKLSN